MEHDAFSRLIQRISAKTGLRLDGQDIGTLRRMVAARMTVHGFPSPEQYGDMLEADSAKGWLEREELISHLTVGESYFFRDKGQFEVLRNIIMPELVARGKATRTLNIWSAGCSTGEEPYSLSILLNEMIPDIADWRVQIIGTDIREEFLEKARKAVYREWSFRQVPQDVRDKYFTVNNGQFKLDPTVKNMVTFSRRNLLDDVFPEPAGDSRGIDLILCRNVFIYYTRKTAAAIAERMAESLRDGGYLITGHWELFSSPTRKLVSRVFPGSLAYQRVAEDFGKTPVLPAVHHSLAADAVAYIPFPALPGTQEKKEPDHPAASVAERNLEKAPDDFQALCLTAHGYANRGEHGRAVECLRKAIAMNPLSAEPYYLLARIAEESGDVDAAKENLGKVIYLDPSSIAAYLDLAAIHDSAGDVEKARKMRMAALDVLRKLPKESIVEPYGTTAAELIRHIDLLLLG